MKIHLLLLSATLVLSACQKSSESNESSLANASKSNSGSSTGGTNGLGNCSINGNGTGQGDGNANCNCNNGNGNNGNNGNSNNGNSNNGNNGNGNCNGTSTGGTSTGGTGGSNGSASNLILESWRSTLPAEFKNISEGQTNYKIGMNTAGDAVISWIYEEKTNWRRRTFVSHRRNLVWTHPTLANPLQVDPTKDIAVQKILVSESGDVRFFFSQEGTLYLREFKNNSWQAPVVLVNYASPTHMDTKFSLSPDGKKIMIMTLLYGEIGTVYFNGTTWSSSGLLAYKDGTKTGCNGLEYSDIAINDSGKAIMTFNFYFWEYIHTKVYRATFDGSAWTMPNSLEASITPDRGELGRVGINNAGKMISLWQSDDGRIYVQEYLNNKWEDKPAYTVAVHRAPVEIFMNETGDYVLLIAGETQVVTMKRWNTIFFDQKQVIPTTFYGKLKMTKTSSSNFTLSWSGENKISYVRCTVAACDATATVLSKNQFGTGGKTASEALTETEVASNRVISFGEVRSNDNAGGADIENAGGEHLTGTPIYEMPLIFYRNWGPPG